MIPVAHRGRDIIKIILNSYSQVFFSTSKLLAVFLVAISFFDYGAGIGGLVAVIVANTLAWGLGYNLYYLRSGLYGFNALLVGLGVGLYYQPSVQLFVLVAVTALLCFFLTVVFQGVLGKYGLPFLSVPFLLTIWIVALSAGSLSALNLSERGIFISNELYSLGGKTFVDFYDFFERNIQSKFIRIFLMSLSAIFFQTHLLAGILITLGLLIYSRITFILSLLGYGTAYLFYSAVGIDFDSLSYTFIGFNYILTAIALGGYYLIPGRTSFGWIILLLPAVVLITISTQQLFMYFRVSPYSLPFNAIVLMFLYTLKLREKRSRYLVEPPVQMGSPEKNLYLYTGNILRFPAKYPVSTAMPFYGEWTVTQGHNGQYTHKAAWRHAWDFVILDREGKQYQNSGNQVQDYYCFGKIVLAPADGIVVTVIDSIHDNQIGDVNVRDNWGNTVVKKGQIVGQCGNSGRSPYPHLHFQFQSNPYIGSATIEYPFGHYLLKEDSGYALKAFDYPVIDQILSNPQKNEILSKALHFIPGSRMQVTFSVNSGSTKWEKRSGEYIWTIETDEYNNSFIRCSQTGAIAFLYNQGDMHFFTNFRGDKNSPLFWFYLTLFKVPISIQPNSSIKDYIPVHMMFGGMLKFLQDILAPGILFLKSEYKLVIRESDDILAPDHIKMKAGIFRSAGGNYIDEISSFIDINQNSEINICINFRDVKLELICKNDLE